jgi:hypothetical protein
MKRSTQLLVAALAVTSLVAAGCGDDDDGADTTTVATQPAATTPPAEPEGGAEETGSMDEETIRAFVAAIDDDPAIICDPDNATEEFLTELGGEAACRESAAAEEPGSDPSEINDITIEGTNATVTVTDSDGVSIISMVTEGDQIKIAGVQSPTNEGEPPAE